MALELNINAEDIEALVRDSIMRSGFGQAIQKAINDALRVGSYNSPIDRAMGTYVEQVCGELIREKYDGPVRAAVAAAIEQKVSAEMIEKVTQATIDKMASAAERY